MRLRDYFELLVHELDIVNLIIAWKCDQRYSHNISMHKAYNLNDAILMKLRREIGFDEDRLWRYKVHRDDSQAELRTWSVKLG